LKLIYELNTHCIKLQLDNQDLDILPRMLINCKLKDEWLISTEPPIQMTVMFPHIAYDIQFLLIDYTHQQIVNDV
jgi:hypothetical protein